MNRLEIFNIVKEIFINVLEEEDIILKEEFNSNDIDGWDSLTHILLIVEIEKKFNLSFLSSEISSWKDIGEMISSIESKI